jgi:hypothetical protein
MLDGNVAAPTDLYNWSPESMLEVLLPDPDSFLKIRETLTRIGVASKNEQTLWQSVHILHKQGKYHLMHFKEMFLLDSRSSDITVDDIRRRNTIATLLQQWGLCKIVTTETLITTDLSNIKVVPYKSKSEWNLVAKYTMRSMRF